jgi:Ca2+/H+ antiporter, TMEM165/GDT1 family
LIGITVMALVFGVVFLAEVPDKTALAGLVLGARYRASYVFAGVAAAFLLHVVLAVAADSVPTLLPQRLVHALTGLLFLGGAAMLLFGRGRRGGDPQARGPVLLEGRGHRFHAHPRRRVR